ncbi:MAG: hypothetical protein ACLPJH_00555 [Myxococcaceae bacterium]
MAFSQAVQLLLAFAVTVVLRAEPEASPAVRPSPEAELEAQLAASTSRAPPPEVRVVVVGPDATLYRLEQQTVLLDGIPVAVSAPADAGVGEVGLSVAADAGVSALVEAGTSAAADGGVSAAVEGVDAGLSPWGMVVSEGDHVLSAKLVYRGQPLGPLPWEEGPRWTLPARVSLQATRGLRFTVRLTVEANPLAPAAQRLILLSEVEPEMVVAVDDAPLPPPPVAHLPQPPPPAPVASAATVSPPPTAAKKKKKKVAKAVPAAAVPAAAKGSSATGSADALEEATARLRSALAAPQDGGAASAGEGPQ